MKHLISLLASALVLLLAASGAELRAEDTAEPETAELKLYTQPARVGRVMTPRRILQYQEHKFQSDSGSITVQGKSRNVRIQTTGRNRFTIGFDGDADGEIGKREMVPVRNGQAVVKVSITDGDVTRSCCILLDKIDVRGKRGGGIGSLAFDAVPCWAMMGRYGRDALMLIDSNLDGQYTQDGADAIVIGRAKCAVPLMTYHAIDGKICRVTVKEDGSAIEIAPQADTPTAKVDHTFGRLAQGLIFTNTEGHSYNLVDAERMGIPPGTYQFNCGLIRRGRENGFIKPGQTGSFEIKADNINTVNLGHPFTLKYKTVVSGDQVKITPYELAVEGALGESYSFRPGFPKEPKPSVTYLRGSQAVRTDQFGYG